MPVCKAEAHRALELLEDYYSRLDDTEEKELKAAIERVIKIFKSRLFQVKNATYKGRGGGRMGTAGAFAPFNF